MRLADLKRVEAATVWKSGCEAARLEREHDGLVFRYLDEYAGPPVAWTLPREGAALRSRGGALPPFFSGLLPEGRRLTALRSAIKTSADDELSLLLAIGRDTIGDVVVLPEGLRYDEEQSSAASKPIEESDFEEVFARVLAPNPADRVGLPGVQDKVSGRMLSLPLARADSAWILKLNPPEYPHLVANEAFFLAAARASGIESADYEVVHDRRGRQGLLVRRFDRVARGGRLLALAQEDACQVLGRYPADKYRVSAEAVVQALAERTMARVVAARSLIQQLAFAYLTCNGDAHAKNFSIVKDRQWRPALAYDIPTTHPYGDTTMALQIQGRDREDIGRKDFLALGEECGVRAKAVERVLDELVGKMPTWRDRLEELPFDARTVHKLRKACSYRADRLRGL